MKRDTCVLLGVIGLSALLLLLDECQIETDNICYHLNIQNFQNTYRKKVNQMKQEHFIVKNVVQSGIVLKKSRWCSEKVPEIRKNISKMLIIRF